MFVPFARDHLETRKSVDIRWKKSVYSLLCSSGQALTSGKTTQYLNRVIIYLT